MPPNTLATTFDQAIAEVKAELATRERVYAAWIRNGKMRPESADKKMAHLRAALHVLIELGEQRNTDNTTRHLTRLRNEDGMPPANG